MPSGTVHATISGATFALAATHLPPLTAAEPETLLLGGTVAVLASLAPDLDHQHSAAARLVWPITAPLAWLISRTLGHRGMLHSAWFAVLVSGAAFVWLPFVLAAGVAIGYLSHVGADACTASGVPSWPGGPRLRLGWR